MNDSRDVKIIKKIVIIFILCLLLLIPISCSMINKSSDKEKSDNNKKNSLIDKRDKDDETLFSDDNDDLEITDEDNIDQNKDLDIWTTYLPNKKYVSKGNGINGASNVSNDENNINNDNNNGQNIKDLEVMISYSSDSPTYNKVTATISSDSELLPIDGWILSSDKKSLTKEYDKNILENVTVKSVDGASTVTTINIKNILDKTKVLTGEDGEFQYVVLDNNEIQLVRYMGSKTDLTIPAVYDGYKVYSVGNPGSDTKKPNSAYNIFGENSTTNTTIKSLTIENGIKKIEAGAFNGCKKIAGQLKLPDSLEKINEFAFANCSGLTGDLVIPNKVTKIGRGTFYLCTGLNGKLTLSDELKEIGYLSFNGCSKLTGDLIIPNGVEIIDSGAFQNCGGLNGILSLPDSLKEVGSHVFNKCSKLTGDLIIPKGITEIKKATFNGCTGFNGKLTLPSALESIGDYAFNGCSKLKLGLNIPEGVTSIGCAAFANCVGLTGDLKIPEGVSSIGAVAFQGCTGFNGKLTLPSTLESIGDYAFNHCEFLTNKSIIIPKSVKIIGSSKTEGSHVFYNTASTHITEFIVEEGNEYFKAVDGVLFTKDGTRLIQYPTSKPGNVYEIPEGVTILDPLSFNRAGAPSAWCSAPDGGLRKIIIPDSLNVIRNGYQQLNDALYKYAGVRYVDVKDTNKKYKSVDGILYSRDGTVLYTVPVARTGIINIEEGVTMFPGVLSYAAARYSQIINIPNTVTYIADFDLSNLKTLGKNRVNFASDCIYQFDSNGNVVKK